MNKAKLENSDILDQILAAITPEEAEKTTKRMLLATRIDDAIIAKGWKKKDFAEAMQKRPSEITKWLSGTHNFTLDTLFDIERVLNIGLISLQDTPVPTNHVITFSGMVSEQVMTTENLPYSEIPTVKWDYSYQRKSASI